MQLRIGLRGFASCSVGCVPFVLRQIIPYFVSFILFTLGVWFCYGCWIPCEKPDIGGKLHENHLEVYYIGCL